jgi:opacity protein-like surface antigen
MKKTLLAGALVAGLSTAAVADPSLTINGAYNSNNKEYTLGVAGGLEVFGFGPMGIGAEGTYDMTKKASSGYQHDVFGNAIVAYKVEGVGVTPYALLGAGYRWDDVAGNEAKYNWGGGLKFALSETIDVDLRARRISSYKGDTPDNDKVTLGVKFKF